MGKNESQLQLLQARGLVFYSLSNQLAHQIPDHLDDQIGSDYAEPAPCLVQKSSGLEVTVSLGRESQQRLAGEHVVCGHREEKKLLFVLLPEK